MTVQHVLMRGNLSNWETEVIEGPRDDSFIDEANALNQKHYEKCYTEYFGKTAKGHYTPNKMYIWWSEEVPEDTTSTEK
ncbi:MAG: hypothetical protein KAT53_03420 [Dehalococcoidia bacterium]|nr:hypothetical protein [Dehalococcoidia bacterium]